MKEQTSIKFTNIIVAPPQTSLSVVSYVKEITDPHGRCAPLFAKEEDLAEGALVHFCPDHTDDIIK